jgi:hypothetical protein
MFALDFGSHFPPPADVPHNMSFILLTCLLMGVFVGTRWSVCVDVSARVLLTCLFLCRYGCCRVNLLFLSLLGPVCIYSWIVSLCVHDNISSLLFCRTSGCYGYVI